MRALGKAATPGGNEQTFWSVRRLVQELASHRLLVLTLGDLHWAEPTLLDLLQRTGKEVTDLPLLLLCDARPELLELHPDRGSEVVGSTIVRLDSLSPADTSVSVAVLLGGDPPDDLASAVAEWSGGHPLLIEESVAHLVESGVLKRDSADEWWIARPLDQVEPLPP